MATAFFKMSRSAAIAPVAQHRGGDAKLACDLEQRPTAAHQHSDRLLLEFIRKLTPSWAHSTPFPLPPELSKSVHQFGGASRRPRVPKQPSRPCWSAHVGGVPLDQLRCLS